MIVWFQNWALFIRWRSGRVDFIGLGWLIIPLLIVLLLSSCSPTVKYLCPPLAPPPSKTIDALETAGKRDPSSAAWVVQLDKHFQKLDACAP